MSETIPPRPDLDPAVVVDEQEPKTAASRPGHSSRWEELDRFRGVAATCMILNHVAVSAPDLSVSRLVAGGELIGGFAPVLFYFATGLGYGIQSLSKGRSRGFGFLVKVGILIVADSDFFLFIGLSMLLLELIRRLPRSEWIAMALVALAIVARFLVGPLVRSTFQGRPSELWIGDFLGTGGHFGYPAGPWLAYPLLGYLLGRLANRSREMLTTRHWLPLWLAFAGLPLAASSFLIVLRGSPLFRYGSISFAYFLASLAMISWVLAFVLLVERSPSLSRVFRPLSISGLRSFAVVPLHYTLRALIGAVVGPPSDALSYLGQTLMVLILSFLGSSAFVNLAEALDRPGFRRATWVIVSIFTLTYYAILRDSTTGLTFILVKSALQLALCLLLSFRAGPSVSR